MDQNNPLVSLVGSIEVGSILILRIDFHFLGNRYPCDFQPQVIAVQP